MRRRAQDRSGRGILWWWVGSLAAVAAVLAFHSGAYVSRSGASTADTVRDVLGERPSPARASRSAHPSKVRDRYEALRQRREGIELGLPRRLRAPLADESGAAAFGAIVPMPPRMDSGDANPDGLLLRDRR